jgi:hypothetical protein
MAQYEDIEIDQGADVSVEIHCVSKDGSIKDLTDHSVAAKLKKTYNSDSADTFSFTSIIITPPSDGIVNISLTNTQTDALKAGRYVYDVELSFQDSDNETIIERVLEGQLHVTPSVTR